MTTQDLDAVLQRIAKLSELTTDRGATQAEAEQAASMIQKLLDKYSLSMEQVKPIKQQSSQDVQFERFNRDTVRWFDWELRLLDAVTYAASVHYVYNSTWITFIGMAQDVTLAKQLYIQFRAIAETLAKRAVREYSANTWQDARSLRGASSVRNYRLSYLIGFAKGLHAAFREAKRASEQANQIQALVLVKDALIETATKERYPHLGKPRNYSSTSNQQAERVGFNDGKAHANRKSLDG